MPTGSKKVGEFVAPGVPDQVTVDWVGPADHRAWTEAVDRQTLLKRVAVTILNQRLSDLALQPGAPFVNAQVIQARSVLHSGSLTSIGVTTIPEKWQQSLDAVTAAEREMLRDGVQPGELKRAVTTLRTEFENRAATAPTRKSADIADGIVSSVNEDKLVTSPLQDLAFVIPILATVTATELNAAMKEAFGDHGPILFRSAQKAPAGDAALAAALKTAYSRTLGPEVKEAAIAWPYTNFGNMSTVVSKRADAKLGTTLVRFANGTRLLVKPTKYEKDKIAVAVLLGNGRAGVAPADSHAIWESQFYPLVGTRKLAFSKINQWTEESGKVVSITLQPANRAFMLTGNTRPSDLVNEMQLLGAYARDPGFRPEAFEKVKSVAPMFAGQIAGQPGAVFSRAAQDLSVGNDPRFENLPSDSDLANVGAKDLQALLAQPLAGQADVVMVGDVTIDQAIKAAQATFGSGPARPRAAAVNSRVTPADGRAQPFVAEHSGRPDQAFYGVYFHLPDYFADPKVDATADVAAAIISTRLIDTVREKLGITYAPQVLAVSSDELPGAGYLGIVLETPPENFKKFHDLLANQLHELATTLVSSDELARAKEPLVATERKNRETNSFWMWRLAQVMRDARIEDKTLTRIDRLSAVTPQDVQSLLSRYAAYKQPVVVIAEAKGSPVQTQAK